MLLFALPEKFIINKMSDSLDEPDRDKKKPLNQFWI